MCGRKAALLFVAVLRSVPLESNIATLFTELSLSPAIIDVYLLPQVRTFAVYLCTNQYFDYIVMFTILVNCIFLAMTKPIDEAE